jgi:hypothetical protein
MKKYTVVGQNVYVQPVYKLGGNDLGGNPELLCIATTVDNAIELAAMLNAAEKYLNYKPEKSY